MIRTARYVQLASFASLLLATVVIAKPPGRPSKFNPAAHLAAPATQSAVTLEQALVDLSSGEWISQWGAMDTLTAVKSKAAVEPLRKLIADKASPWIRAHALTSLATILGEEALVDVTPLAGEDDPQIRAAAVQSLGLIGSMKGKDIVLKLMTDKVPAVQQEALVSLARIDKAAAWDTLLPHFKDGDPLQPASIRAAAWIGSDEARAKVTAALGNPYLRDVATEAITAARDAKLIPAMITSLTGEKDRYRLGIWEKAMLRFDAADFTAPMLGVIKQNNPNLVRSAVKLLQSAPSKEVCDQVAGQLKSIAGQDPLALPLAFDLLSRFDADGYKDAIIPFLHHATPDVRRSAIEAISRARTADHFALYQDELTDTDKTVRAAAYQAIRRATQTAPEGGIVKYLAKPLESTDREMFYPALELLRDRLSRAEITPALAALDKFIGGSDKDLREFAAKAVAGVADEQGAAQIARAQGFIAPWMVIGPFTHDPADGTNGIDTPYPPEAKVDFDKSYPVGEERQVTWALFLTTRLDGAIDFTYAYQQDEVKRTLPADPKIHRIAYACVDLMSEADQKVNLAMAAQRSGAVWLNGQRLGGEANGNVEIDLHKGANRLLVKVAADGTKDWSLRVQLLDKAGHRPAGVTSTIPAAPATQPAATQP